MFPRGFASMLALLAMGLQSPIGAAQTLPSRASARHEMAARSAARRCARVGNDDHLLPYTPAFRSAFAQAFADGGDVPGDATLATGVVRCMDHRLYGCLIGANQPCYKMNRARENPGAAAFCRENPDAASVPLAASGHGSIYDYACAAGHARITRTEYQVDQRGFARGLWRALD